MPQAEKLLLETLFLRNYVKMKATKNTGDAVISKFHPRVEEKPTDYSRVAGKMSNQLTGGGKRALGCSPGKRDSKDS